MSDYYGIFDDRDEEIKSKTPFVGELPFDMEQTYNWNEFMNMMDSHPDDLYDRNSDKMRIGLNSFHSRGSAPDFAKKIYEEMQEVFTLHANKITNIAFSGFGRDSGSYPWHKDSMDVFLVQVISTVGLKVEGINNNEPFDFKIRDVRVLTAWYSPPSISKDFPCIIFVWCGGRSRSVNVLLRTMYVRQEKE